MKPLFTLCMMVGLAIGLAPRRAVAETEWVLILDNSGSMSVGTNICAPTRSADEPCVIERVDPPADPYRIAVIATLIFRSFLDASDKLTILTFQCCDPYPVPPGTKPQKKVGLFQTLPNTEKAIRELGFNEMTPFTGPMQQTKKIFEASKAPKKILLLVTDGAPTKDDPLDADTAKTLLGLDGPTAPYEVISIAIAPNAQTATEQVKFLKPLGTFEQVENPAQLVSAFAKVYAESIRSRPDSGTLQPGGKLEFRAPRYVSEVMVALATVNRIGAFTAELDAQGKKIVAIDGGDSGCDDPKNPPGRTPCHAYQVFKAKKDTDADEKWTLALPGNVKGPIAYGIILRYDLGAEIISMSEAKAGEDKEIIARLTYRGQGFNDARFFKADGFEAHALLDGVEVPLTLRPDDGSFVGTIKVGKPGKQAMVVRFRNKWLTVTANRMFDAEAWLPLELRPTPTPIDFGTWSGERGESERCVDVDFSKSLNADKVPLEMFGKGLPGELRIVAPKGVVKTTARVCLVAPGCCSDYAATDKAVLVIRGVNPHYHPSAIEVPLRFAITPTPFITCWWRVIAGAIGTILAIIVIYGFIKPFDFDNQEVIRLSGKEVTLARASGRRLRELPGGKRGFYRDARVAFDGSGGAVKPGSGAVLIFKATRNDAVVVSKTTIEHKDPRTRKWAAVTTPEGTPLYLRRAVVYRIGDVYFQLG